MFQESPRVRNFKGGSWDLRKNERRTEQHSIGFPDRRVRGRRMVDKATEGSFASDKLLWVTKSELDE
jgi:hypothetical protein